MHTHLVAYSSDLPNAANQQLVAVPDGVFSVRNNRLIVTEPYAVVAAYVGGQHVTRCRWDSATLNQLSDRQIWPLNRTPTPPSPPNVVTNIQFPYDFPQSEEVGLIVHTDGPSMGNANVHTFVWLATSQFTPRVAPYREHLTVRATATIQAGSATSWSDLYNLTFSRELVTGVYAVIGASCVIANGLAFRLRFPDQGSVRGKQLRPGGLCGQNAGTFEWPFQHYGLGEWGRFHTFSPPELQILGQTSAGTAEVYLDVAYLGRDESLLVGR